MAVLEVTDLTMDFGGLRAVDHVSLEVNDREIVALIGPNGAGKTTFFNCVTGVYTPTAGNVRIDPPKVMAKGTTSRFGAAEDIHGKLPHVINHKGLARTFQNIRLFQNMTVLENVMIGRHGRLHAGIAGAVFRNRRTREEEQQLKEDAYRILKKIRLDRWVNEQAKNLPYGEQRRLEIARALASEPFILLLDEPAAGMNPQETRELVDLILRLREEERVSVLLIEHDMSLVMTLSEKIYVMDYGKRIAVGTPAEVKHDPVVIKAYLGEDVDA